MNLRKWLKKYPFFEKLFRRIYLYVKYFIHGSINFEKELNKHVKMFEISKNNGRKSKKYFGYYDKSPWSDNGDYYLFHELKNNKQISINCIDIKNESKIINVGHTKTWNYQQGAMLQWLPNMNEGWLIYNNCKNNILGSIIYNIKNSNRHFLNWPVQSVNPNGKTAVSINYPRLSKVNKEYSYKGTYSNFPQDLDDEIDGLWCFSLSDNKSELLISISDLKNYKPNRSMINAVHCVNHAMYSPTGNNILFIHRWLTHDYIRYSRLYVINESSKKFNLLMDEEMVSHYCWLDSNSILTYASDYNKENKYFIVDLINGSINEFGNEILNSYGDGHPGLSPDDKWIVTDTYPDAARKRTLLLWNISDKNLIEIGKFYSPVSFEDEKRCDLHPRWHPTKPLISIDSAHDGTRKNYIIDVENLTGKF